MWCAIQEGRTRMGWGNDTSSNLTGCVGTVTLSQTGLWLHLNQEQWSESWVFSGKLRSEPLRNSRGRALTTQQPGSDAHFHTHYPQNQHWRDTSLWKFVFDHVLKIHDHYLSIVKDIEQLKIKVCKQGKRLNPLNTGVCNDITVSHSRRCVCEGVRESVFLPARKKADVQAHCTDWMCPFPPRLRWCCVTVYRLHCKKTPKEIKRKSEQLAVV